MANSQPEDGSDYRPALQFAAVKHQVPVSMSVARLALDGLPRPIRRSKKGAAAAVKSNQLDC